MVTGRPGPGEPGHPLQRVPGRGRRRGAAARRTCTARTARAPATPTSPTALDLLAARAAAGALHRPRRDAVGGGPGDHRSSRSGCGIPVITSPNGMGCIPADDPLTLGFIGRNGAYPANQAGPPRRPRASPSARASTTARSSSWHPGYSWNFPKTQAGARRHRPAGAGPQLPADARHHRRRQGVHARSCSARWPRAQRGIDAPALRRVARAGAGWQAEWEAFVRPHFGDSTTPLRPEFVVDALQKVLPDDVILTLDSGVHHNWFMQFWKPRRPQSMLNSWGYSSMGFGVCGVLGAQLAAPDRPCVSVVRRRRLHDDALRRVHRGRVRPALRLGGLEQLRLGARSATSRYGMFGGREHRHGVLPAARPARSPTTRTSPPGRAPAAPTA